MTNKCTVETGRWLIIIQYIVYWMRYLATWITVVILELIHAIKPRLPGGVYLLDKKPTRFAAPLVIHNNFSIAWPCAGDASFKYLPYQLSMGSDRGLPWFQR